MVKVNINGVHWKSVVMVDYSPIEKCFIFTHRNGMKTKFSLEK